MKFILFQTLKLFYHAYQEEYKEEKPFLGNLAENEHVTGALTLHHLKVPYIMYRVHRHYTSMLLNETAQVVYGCKVVQYIRWFGCFCHSKKISELSLTCKV